jgi:hypothetical protein
MNLTPHIAPRWSAHRTIGTTAASFGKNSMERVDVTLEEYNGIDLQTCLSPATVRASTPSRGCAGPLGTSISSSKQLLQLIASLKEGEATRHQAEPA